MPIAGITLFLDAGALLRTVGLGALLGTFARVSAGAFFTGAALAALYAAAGTILGLAAAGG